MRTETYQNATVGLATERHYAPDELGQLWNLSADTVRRLFEREPVVLVIERAQNRARRYRILRIPESVAQRVHRQLTNPSLTMLSKDLNLHDYFVRLGKKAAKARMKKLKPAERARIASEAAKARWAKAKKRASK